MGITIVEANPNSPEAVGLINELDQYLNQLPYPEHSRHAYSIDKLLREGVAFFVAQFEGNSAACGGIKLVDGEYGEIKRMYVRPVYRGLGLGKAMLNHLAEYARERQVNLLRLETGIFQTEAIGLYDGYGFQRRSPFGDYVADPMTLYFEKSIALER